MSHSPTDDRKLSPSATHVGMRHSEEEILHDDNQSESHGDSDSDSKDDGSENNERGRSKTPRPRRLTLGGRRDSEALVEMSDRNELVRIATALSRRHSIATGGLARIHTLATQDENAPALDPQSEHFDLSKWLQNFVKTLREQGVTAKQTGVLFKDLNVSGSGAALQVQETVGSMLLSPLRIGELFSFGKKEPKQILKSFDGLVRSGELLIVLGRPGSGCSTLLKTLCGELHGLAIDSNSSVHYDGIPQKLMKKEFKGEAIYNQEVNKSHDIN